MQQQEHQLGPCLQEPLPTDDQGENWTQPGSQISVVWPCHGCVLSHFSCVRLCDCIDLAHQAPLSKGFSWENTGVGGQALLQGIFPAYGWNLYLLRSRQILCHWATREAQRRWQWHVCYWYPELAGSVSLGYLPSKSRDGLPIYWRSHLKHDRG